MSNWFAGVTRIKLFLLAILAVGGSSALIGCSTVAVYFAQQETGIALEADCKFEKNRWDCEQRVDEKNRAFTLEALREERCSVDMASGKKCNASFNGAQTHTWEPPPTAVPVPAGVDVRYVIGGKGAGLNCSIPKLAQQLFIDPIRNETSETKTAAISPAALQYAQACTSHDYCYRHGLATYGYAQPDCDDMLFDHAYRICAAVYDKPGINNCQQQAALVRMGVRIFGKTAYQGIGESTYFEFDPMARGARKPFSVARIVESKDTNRRVLKTYHLSTASYVATTDREQLPVQSTPDESMRSWSPPVLTVENVQGQAASKLWIMNRAMLRNTGYDLRGLDKYDNKVSRERKEFDCNAANARITSKANSALIVASGLASAPDEQEKDKCLKDINLASRAPVAVRSVRGKNIIKNNWYRLYDQPFLEGVFDSNNEELLFFARGYDAKNESDSSAGIQYKKRVSLVSLGKYAATNSAQTEVVEMREEEAPLSAFRTINISKHSSPKDILISVVANEKNNTVCLRSWTKTNGTWSVGTCNLLNTKNIDASWLQMPAQVVRTSGGHDELLFTRVCLQTAEYCSMNFARQWKEVAKGQFDPKMVFLSSQTWRFKDETWKQAAVTNDQQIDLLKLTQALTTTDPTEHQRDIFLKSRIAPNEQLAADFLSAARFCKDAKMENQGCTKARQLAALLWYHGQAIAALNPISGSPAAMTAYFVPHPFSQFYEEVHLK